MGLQIQDDLMSGSDQSRLHDLTLDVDRNSSVSLLIETIRLIAHNHQKIADPRLWAVETKRSADSVVQLLDASGLVLEWRDDDDILGAVNGSQFLISPLRSP